MVRGLLNTWALLMAIGVRPANFWQGNAYSHPSLFRLLLLHVPAIRGCLLRSTGAWHALFQPMREGSTCKPTERQKLHVFLCTHVCILHACMHIAGLRHKYLPTRHAPVRVRARAHTHTHTHIHTHTHTSAHTHTHTHVHAHTHTYTHAHAHTHTHTHTRTYTHTNTHTHTHTYTHMHTHAPVYLLTLIPSNGYTYRHAHTLTHTEFVWHKRTQTHTHKHTIKKRSHAHTGTHTHPARLTYAHTLCVIHTCTHLHTPHQHTLIYTPSLYICLCEHILQCTRLHSCAHHSSVHHV